MRPGGEGIGTLAGSTGDALTRLRDLEALTDSALDRRDVEPFLDELVRRIGVILDADTAAVLLLDEASQELVATAACGIEEEVRQAMRVSVGWGFAGRVAQLKRPVALERIDSTTVTNPILWEKGIKVMLGVPLLAEGRLIGVLHVGRLDQRPFTSTDTDLLQVVAERIASAIQAQRLAADQAAATVLERSLLPERLPDLDGLEMAARYVPTEERKVGGDWYDVFVGSSGRLWAVTGDVAGHGLSAAVIMGRVRSALRAYALLEESPAGVLELTDRKVQHFEFGALVTAICATSLPPYDEWRIATAGHPPAMIAAGGKGSFPVELPIGPPLGTQDGIVRSSATVALPSGGVLLLYTDGLIERRDEALDAGLARLGAAIRPDAPADVCRHVLHDLIGSENPNDDVALLAIRRTDTADDR